MSAPGTLAGRVGVVTGAGHEPGRATALRLAEERMHLAVVAATGERVGSLADEVAERSGRPVLPAAVDLGDPAAVDRLVAHVEQHLGTVDLLVQTVGATELPDRPLAETAPDQARRDDPWPVAETGLRAPFLLCRALLPAMVQRGHGHVVTVVSDLRAAAGRGTRAESAVAGRPLSAFVEALAVPLAGTGVVVLGVLAGEPGALPTRPPGRGRVSGSATSAVADLVADIAAGRYDDRCGQVIRATDVDAG